MKTAENGNVGAYNVGTHNDGDHNAGDHNCGSHNDGTYNRGYYNEGHHNVGHHNYGHHNFGYHNIGSSNLGTSNIGDNNIGYQNYGDYNIGDQNRGYYNSTVRACGCFNTRPTLEYSIFNVPTDEELLFDDVPAFLQEVCVTTWIPIHEMTDEEKRDNPSCKTCGGYLRRNYKEVIRKAWDAAPEAERREVLDLPNWNNEIFKEITGIDVENELQNQSQSNKED